MCFPPFIKIDKNIVEELSLINDFIEFSKQVKHLLYFLKPFVDELDLDTLTNYWISFSLLDYALGDEEKLLKKAHALRQKKDISSITGYYVYQAALKERYKITFSQEEKTLSKELPVSEVYVKHLLYALKALEEYLEKDKNRIALEAQVYYSLNWKEDLIVEKQTKAPYLFIEEDFFDKASIISEECPKFFVRSFHKLLRFFDNSGLLKKFSLEGQKLYWENLFTTIICFDPNFETKIFLYFLVKQEQISIGGEDYQKRGVTFLKEAFFKASEKDIEELFGEDLRKIRNGGLTEVLNRISDMENK